MTSIAAVHESALAQSGHPDTLQRMSALRSKAAMMRRVSVSAFGPWSGNYDAQQ